MCSVDLRLKIIGELPFFAGLSSDDIQQISQSFHDIGYEPGETICLMGDPAERLFVVADGRVKLMQHSLSGKNILLDMLTPGEFFGSLSVLSNDVYPDTAEAQTQTCVLSVNSSDFHRVLEKHPKVAMKVLEITAARLRNAQEHIRHLSALSVDGRVANVLLVLGRKFGKQSNVGLLIESPLTREDLAAMTGTTTESASRVMS